MELVSNRLVQTAFAEVSSTQSTTAGPYVNLLTIPITTSSAGKYLIVDATMGVIGGNAGTVYADFRLLVDGVARRGCRVVITSAVFDVGSIAQRVAVNPGGHTVTLQWGVTNVSSGTPTLVINPAVNGQHASLRVKEVTA